MKLTLNVAFAATAVLGSLSAGALATPVDISSGSAGFVSTPGSGGFSDTYTFTLASTTTANMLFSSATGGGQNVDFTSISLTGPGGDFTATALFGDPFESWAIKSAILTPGSYTLTAVGLNSAAVGTYAGNIALSGSGFTSSTGSGGPLDLSSGSTGFVSTPGAGTFSDAYTFTLASGRAVNLLLSSVVGGEQNVNLTSVTLTGPSGTFAAAEFNGDPFESWSLNTPLLNPGSYTITTKGINSAAVGTYVASLAVSEPASTPPNAIPEPATWALLLAGLGAAHAATRRRRALIDAKR